MGFKVEILKEAERIQESSMYSAQTQFEYSKTWRTVDRWVGGFASLIAVISGVSGIAEITSAQVAGIIALIAAGAGAVSISLGAPKTKARAHASANAYLALQQDTRVFIDIDINRMSEEQAREELSNLIGRHQELNVNSEIPSKRAWKKSRKNIDAGAQKYEVDE